MSPGLWRILAHTLHARDSIALDHLNNHTHGATRHNSAEMLLLLPPKTVTGEPVGTPQVALNGILAV